MKGKIKKTGEVVELVTSKLRGEIVLIKVGTGLVLSLDEVELMPGAKMVSLDDVCKWLEKYAANFVALPDPGQEPIGDTNAIYGTKSLIHYLRQEMGD